jgi:hypothetical protein
MDDNCWRILLKEQNNNCRRWLSEFDPDVIAIYNCLAQAPRLTMNLKKKTNPGQRCEYGLEYFK